MGLVQKLDARTALRVGPYTLSAVADRSGGTRTHRLRVEGGGPPLLMAVKPQRTYELADGLTVTVCSLRSCGQIVVNVEAPAAMAIERLIREPAAAERRP